MAPAISQAVKLGARGCLSNTVCRTAVTQQLIDTAAVSGLPLLASDIDEQKLQAIIDKLGNKVDLASGLSGIALSTLQSAINDVFSPNHTGDTEGLGTVDLPMNTGHDGGLEGIDIPNHTGDTEGLGSVTIQNNTGHDGGLSDVDIKNDTGGDQILDNSWQDNILTSQKPYEPNKGSVGNMGEFLGQAGFGSNVKDNSNKTSRQYQGQSIYTANKPIGEFIQKGDQFYLDGQHKNHIEVFDKRGNFRAVLNLDGSINEAKTKAAAGRKLK